jgi:signal transduction histidine kinase
VAVRLRWLDDCVEVLVKDNGRGFRRTGRSDFSDLKMGVSEATDCFGLFNIQERVSDLGGRVWLHTEPQRGTAVKIHLPLDRTAGVAAAQVRAGRAAGESREAA